MKLKILSRQNADALIAADTDEFVSPELCASPLVSVCFITYQHAPFVKEALDSVLAQQTDFEFEIVIGEDGSTDGTFEIVRDYTERFPRKIRLLHSRKGLGKHTGNGRLNGIRNLNACRGKYIAFLEGDDYWTCRTKLQQQVALLEGNPKLSAACHDTDVLDSNSGEQRPWRKLSCHHFTLETTISPLSPFHTSSFMFRKECSEQLPDAFLRVHSADMFRFIIAASKGDIQRIPETMSVYRKHAGGITNSPNHQGASLHLNRCEMHRALRKHLAPHGKKHFDSVINTHWVAARQLLQESHPTSQQIPVLSGRWRFKMQFELLVQRHLSRLRNLRSRVRRKWLST